ncbi:DoxX family protein [Mariniflexile gromovii]|uniref:DoxX family protein n=1 Tax=Mariniflexile gromovii TaxID=362523 RepID=A0ABS4BUH2_9FLAO|nr:DoxX family protein [Mariniflexile gromovii]MBP0904239.1 DoxX family protein [Mariniflexile gromovii]
METKKKSKAIVWISYILQGIIVLMFLMGAFMNLSQNEEAIKGAIAMGYPRETMLYLGIVQLIAIILYAIPRTVTIGAILITGWLGGAVATHVIHKDPIFNLFFPVIFGIVVWGSIWLRNNKLKALLSN